MLYRIIKFKNLLLFCTLVFLGKLMIFSNIGLKGAKDSLLLCAETVVPSLFPFTFAVLFLTRLNISKIFVPFQKITQKIFNMDADLFSVFVLSFLGGYPSGAKLISELKSNEKINEDTANNMLLFCVNAGPGYILIAVGSTILHSNICGIILLASHILSSIIIALIMKKRTVITKNEKHLKKPRISTVDAFISSVSDAGDAIIKICFFVILFGVFNEYIKSFYPTKYLSLFTEVTSAVAGNKNIYLISFLLGFSGLSIWCQVLSSARCFKVNTVKFSLFRILHGALSVMLTYITVLIFKPAVPTFSSNDIIKYSFFENPVKITIALVLMLVILIITIENKITCRKIKNDLL